jgi:hypothetical protein
MGLGLLLSRLVPLPVVEGLICLCKCKVQIQDVRLLEA